MINFPVPIVCYSILLCTFAHGIRFLERNGLDKRMYASESFNSISIHIARVFSFVRAGEPEGGLHRISGRQLDT